MSHINITNIELLSNPAPFTAPLAFQVTFECLKDLPDEIEWKIIYVGSSKDEKYDQLLDSFTMGPIQFGIMQFEIESNPPDPSKIPKEEILGVTAIILSVSYRSQEFFRVGYYVYNTYTDPELVETPPEEVLIEKINRNILKDKPRITRFDIKWGDEKEEDVQGSTEEGSYAGEVGPTSDLCSIENPTGNVGNPFLCSSGMQMEEFNNPVPGMELNQFMPQEEGKSVF